MDMKRGEYMFAEHLDASTLKSTVTRLFEGTDYVFRVFAENPAGLSAPAETQQPIRAKMPFGELPVACPVSAEQAPLTFFSLF